MTLYEEHLMLHKGNSCFHLSTIAKFLQKHLNIMKIIYKVEIDQKHSGRAKQYTIKGHNKTSVIRLPLGLKKTSLNFEVVFCEYMVLMRWS